VLVIASKVKNYIKSASGLNSSGAIIEILSDKIRELCDAAIEKAKNDGRKTVKDKDLL
jgi:histone H3/H4